MNIFKKLFGNNNNNQKKNIQSNQNQTSEYINTTNNRILRLKNDDCALVFHPNGKVEVIFTKFYNNETQQITPEEQTLMAFAVFLKQPGFSELLRTEFNNIAIKNFKILSNNKGDSNE